EEIVVGIGPSIGPCCFEVGADVVSALFQALPQWADHLMHTQDDGKVHLDLWEANAAQLRAVGVREIEVAAVCTRCRRDLYFSHRGDGGHTGRFAALIAAGG
ncbi:MAG: polyphenol oxidase family protein, partial [Chloroflexi bacterium]|nr:polyphenol oxidase family protein [Chloroflexota bacterium]